MATKFKNGIYIDGGNADTASGQVYKIGGTNVVEGTTLGSGGTAKIFGKSIGGSSGTVGNIVDESSVQTLTNKTYDTAGAGNVLKINGTQVSDKTGTGKVVLDTNPTISGTSTSITNVNTFALRDTSANFDVTIAATSSTALTAGRTLTLDLVNASKTVKLGGNLTTASSFTTSGAFALTLTTTASTNVTLPTTGTLATRDGTETLTSKTLASPKVNNASAADGIYDSNGSALIGFPSTVSSVLNYLQISNSASTNPSIAAAGLSTNVNIDLTPKGTGAVRIAPTGTGDKIHYYNDSTNVYGQGVGLLTSVSFVPSGSTWTWGVGTDTSSATSAAKMILNSSGTLTPISITPSAQAAALNMNTQKVTNLANPTASGDAVHAGHTLSGTVLSSTTNSVNKVVDGKSLNYGLNGFIAPNGYTSYAARSVTSNQVYFARFYCPADIVVTKIVVTVTTASATASDWIDCGIFDTSSNKLATTGTYTGINATGALVTTLGGGTSPKSGSANYQLTGGTTYYIAGMTSLTSGSVTYSGCGAGQAFFGTTAGQWLFGVSTATGTTTSLNAATVSLPTITVSTGTGAGVCFAVRTD